MTKPDDRAPLAPKGLQRRGRRLRRGGAKGSRAGGIRPRPADLRARRDDEPAADLGPRAIAAGADVRGRGRRSAASTCSSSISAA